MLLLLQPLLGRNGNNVCDVPVLAKETIRFQFLDTTTSSREQNRLSIYTSTISSTNVPIIKDTTESTKKKWWWRPEENINKTINVEDHMDTDNDLPNDISNNEGVRYQVIRDGFIVNNDKNANDRTTSKRDSSFTTEETGFDILAKPTQGIFNENIFLEKIYFLILKLYNAILE